MSTNIVTLQGTKGYEPRHLEVSFTRFYGGAERGASLQVTIHSEHISYIQLDNETTKNLIRELVNAYPDYRE